MSQCTVDHSLMGQRDVATRGLHTLQQRALKRQKKKKKDVLSEPSTRALLVSSSQCEYKRPRTGRRELVTSARRWRVRVTSIFANRFTCRTNVVIGREGHLVRICNVTKNTLEAEWGRSGVSLCAINLEPRKRVTLTFPPAVCAACWFGPSRSFSGAASNTLKYIFPPGETSNILAEFPHR
jgi:hypothetical protein